nr:hypothetical protein [Sphingobacterium thalpophilum]
MMKHRVVHDMLVSTLIVPQQYAFTGGDHQGLLALGELLRAFERPDGLDQWR